MHTGGGGESSTPSIYFEKFGQKNAIKHKNRGTPPPHIFSQTQIKEFENDCTSMDS
jgi:hypothetical protein